MTTDFQVIDPAELAALRAQRDALATALRTITDDYEDLLKQAGPHRWGMITVETACAALATFNREGAA